MFRLLSLDLTAEWVVVAHRRVTILLASQLVWFEPSLLRIWTAAFIGQVISRIQNGKIIGGTKQVVARSSLDNDGRYDPNQHRKEPAQGTNSIFIRFANVTGSNVPFPLT
jgi:hypothetical protein